MLMTEMPPKLPETFDEVACYWCGHVGHHEQDGIRITWYCSVCQRPFVIEDGRARLRTLSDLKKRARRGRQ